MWVLRSLLNCPRTVAVGLVGEPTRLPLSLGWAPSGSRNGAEILSRLHGSRLSLCWRCWALGVRSRAARKAAYSHLELHSVNGRCGSSLTTPRCFSTSGALAILERPFPSFVIAGPLSPKVQPLEGGDVRSRRKVDRCSRKK